MNLRRNSVFGLLNSVGTAKGYGDVYSWTECILHYETASSLCGQGVEGYGLKTMCLGVKLTRGGFEIANIDYQVDWIWNYSGDKFLGIALRN